MSVKCILQDQNDKSPKLYFNKILPDKPTAPIAADVQIPYSWEELNAIALSGEAADYVSVGAIKSVTLTNTVLGTTTHDVRIIGINQDNDQSITFQTKNCLNNYLTNGFGTSAVYSSSYAKTECQNYYNAFPGKAFIKTVSKGTNTSYNSSSVVYTDETVFTPSIHEMGLASYSYAPSAGEYTNGVSTAYSYYISDNSRIKKKSDSGNVCLYWTRSRAYVNSNFVCYVNGDGVADINPYNNTYRGLAPAFVIGNEEVLSKDALIQDNEDVTEKVKEIVKPTIEEIGAAPADIAAVRYDIAQSLTAVQQEQTRGNINAAPGGVGLGEESAKPSDDADSITKTGWYIVSGDKLPDQLKPYQGNTLLHHEAFSKSFAFQTLYLIGVTSGIEYKGVKVCRYKESDIWGPWEWVNPSMNVGIEYRTTERYHGVPVYAKLVDCGNLPNATEKIISDYAENVLDIVDFGGMSRYFGQSLLNETFTILHVTQSQITFSCTTDLSVGSAEVWVKYTKSTD